MKDLEIPADVYAAIASAIGDADSPVGIDAKRTHVMILHKLLEIERRLTALEQAESLTHEQNTRLRRLAAGELDRAMREMRIPGHPRPYYLSFLIRDEETWQIQARYGSCVNDVHERKRNGLVDVRVGSYRQDQVKEGGLDDNDKDAESYNYVELPWGSHGDGLRHGLWRLADARYREAVDALLQKQAHELTYRDQNSHLRAFEKQDSFRDIVWNDLPEVDHDGWVDYVERASSILRRYPDICDSYVEFRADHVVRTFVSSEGATFVECQPIWSLESYVWLLSPSGEAVPWTHKLTVTDPLELPERKEFEAQMRETVRTVRRVAQAPLLRSFSGPALLEPIPAGLLLHEALGHRLEGHRLLSTGEGQTFKDAIGRSVLPPSLSLRDDPRLSSFEGQSLVGHYRYDDEGVPAGDAQLVDRGKLVGYLTGRAGIARRHRSNGHGRSSYHERAISRMGVLLAEPHDGLEAAALRRRLLDEIKRQKVPFGVRIVHATAGETATDAYNFQAFLGEVNLASKVFPDGREEWIRGANFVGTPLNATRSIVAAGNRCEVDNAYCGAESGYVPVSTISPALVVSELELQSKPDPPYTPYTFPIPWAKRVRR